MFLEYIDAVKRGLIEQHGFPENPAKPGCVLGEVPDGEYPMTINGKVDHVRIEAGRIHCCNFKEEEKPASQKVAHALPRYAEHLGERLRASADADGQILVELARALDWFHNCEEAGEVEGALGMVGFLVEHGVLASSAVTLSRRHIEALTERHRANREARGRVAAERELAEGTARR